ncbi:MAG: hypothetical protein AAF616_14700, partial [Bacteroidota bacterium]
MKRSASLSIRIFIGFIAFHFVQVIYSQEFSAGINVEDPNPNAVLHLVSPNGNQGLLIPKLTNAQRTGMTLTASDEGLMVYDEQDGAFYFWSGSAWVVINVGNSNGITSVATDATLNGDGTVSNQLSVNAGTGANQIVQLDGSAALPALDGSNLVNLNDGDNDPTNEIELPATATTGQILEYDGTDWIAGNAASGDMSQSVYDTDGDNVVDNAQLVNGFSVESAVPSGAAFTDGQTLNLTGTNLEISGGNTIDVSGIAGTDTQALSVAGTDLSITGGNTVDLSVVQDGFEANTDAQTLSLTGTDLSITGGNTLDVSSIAGTDAQDLTLTGNTLALTNDPSTIDLSTYLDNTDTQTLSVAGTDLSITGGNMVDLSVVQDGFEANTDAQTLSLTGTDLIITGGNTLDVSSLAGTDAQDLTLTGNTLALTNDPSTIDLSTYLDNTDTQTLSVAGTDLSITGGNMVDLSVIQDGFEANTDAQTLSLTGTDLSIAGGNTLDVSSLAGTDDQQIDNLSLTGSILNISLQDDAVPDETVDLSSINTDSQDLANVLGNGNDAGGFTITNAGAPVAGTDVATKDYVDTAPDNDNQDLANVLGNGNDAGGFTITNAGAPVAGTDVATKDYVDTAPDNDNQD